MAAAKMVLVTIGEYKKRVEFFGFKQDLIRGIQDKFDLAIVRISHLQIWDKDFDDYVDLEEQDEIPDKAKINVVLKVPECTPKTQHPDPPSGSTASSGGKVTIESLKMEMGITDRQLDAEVEGSDLYKVAGCFSKVDDNYLTALGLSGGQQSDVRDAAHRHGTQAAMSKALNMWHTRNPFNARFRVLINIFLDCDDNDAAKKLLNYLKKLRS